MKSCEGIEFQKLGPGVCFKQRILCKVYELHLFIIIERLVPGPDQVGEEAGEAVPGRTDGHVGEVQVRDGESLYGGGDRTGGPAGEGLLDQDSGSNESSDDDREPEESDETSGGGDVDQAVDGGGLQELPDNLHSAG